MKESLRLVKLYLAYHLNKTFLILLSITSIFLIGIIFLNLGLPINEIEYHENKTFFHTEYLKQTLYFINILNSIIIASLIGNEVNSISSFDPMFVSFIKRRKIIFSKIITNFIIITIILLIETLLIFLFGSLFYPDFILKFVDLIIIPYQLVYLYQLIIFGEFLVIIFNNFFVTILIFIFSFIINILSKVENIKEYIYMLIPLIEIESCNEYILKGNLLFFSFINISLILITIILYEKKDIK